MATKRIITSNIWEDDFFGSLTMLERLLWIGMFSRCADDQGRMIDNAIVIRSQVFPYDDIPVSEIEKGLNCFNQASKIIRYEVDGKRYIQLVNWWDHQQGQWAMPSKYPAPPTWTDRVRCVVKNVYREENWPKKNPTKPAQVEAPGGQPTWTPDVDRHEINLNHEINQEKESSGVAGEEAPPEKPPQKASELEPSTPGGRKLFARLQANAKAKGRRGPRQFETPEQRDKFLVAEKRLPPDELERAITAGLEAGAFERARIIAWVAKWGSGNGRYHPPDDPGLPQKIICDASRGYNQ